MSRIQVVGHDPSLRHWGLAAGTYDLVTKEITIDHVDVIEPVLPSGKQIRRNSQDLEAARQISEEVHQITRTANAVFVEVPHGSQSARAAAGYGVCVGILGFLRSQGTPFFELSESEVKLATVGKKTSTKKEMIEWATSRHPDAPWSSYKRNGELLLSEAKVEHQADAVAAIYAGVQHPLFLQSLQMRLNFQ